MNLINQIYSICAVFPKSIVPLQGKICIIFLVCAIRVLCVESTAPPLRPIDKSTCPVQSSKHLRLWTGCSASPLAQTSEDCVSYNFGPHVGRCELNSGGLNLRQTAMGKHRSCPLKAGFFIRSQTPSGHHGDRGIAA
ncbi:hypothetical protein OS493_032886 [Desmophyllum pertusum]|uniref:Uncharacterized protein n=1 Tax=Desmophyllum pertusum TaxID=174260 RepID=A0A9W9YJ83_9CNID|nr:hypothetical protein OS493_032886 [Desmophyllum pertusum]